MCECSTGTGSASVRPREADREVAIQSAPHTNTVQPIPRVIIRSRGVCNFVLILTKSSDADIRATAST